MGILKYTNNNGTKNISNIKFNGNVLCGLNFNGEEIIKNHNYDILNASWGVCTNPRCSYYDPNHDHQPDDQEGRYCKLCNFDILGDVREKTSDFFIENYKPKLPTDYSKKYSFQKARSIFTPSNDIYIDCVRSITNKNGIQEEPETGSNGHYIRYDDGIMPYPDVYCENGSTDDYLFYTINAPKAGIYDLGIHYRIDDHYKKGALFIANKNTPFERTLATTYQFNSANDLKNFRNNSFLNGVYTANNDISLELQTGINTLTIESVPGVERNQCFRDIYLHYREAACDHNFNNGDTCTKCGKPIRFGAIANAEPVAHDLGPGVKLPDNYLVEVEFNRESPRESDGFCKVFSNGGRLVTINSINPGSFAMPIKNSICTLRGKIGCVASVENSTRKRSCVTRYYY